MKLFKIKNFLKLLHLRTTIISGTVLIAGLPAVREIVCFKNSMYEIIVYSGWSNPDGTFSFTVIGCPNDKFTVFCVGRDDLERTTIFSSISGV